MSNSDLHLLIYLWSRWWAANALHYIASNDRIIMEYWIRKELCPNLRKHPEYLLGMTDESHENLSQDSQSLDWDSYWGLSGYNDIGTLVMQSLRHSETVSWLCWLGFSPKWCMKWDWGSVLSQFLPIPSANNFQPLCHAYLSLAPEGCNSSDQTAHCHPLGL